MNRISLCVPTHRRAALLQRMLDQVFAAIVRHAEPQRFQVVISDNASADDTAAVVDRIESRFPSVEVQRQRQLHNLGFAGNFAAVARLATGDVFIILADDDELLPDSLDTLLLAAKRMSPATPLVLLDSLPGGDVVFRGQRRPTAETVIYGPNELLRLLGIFHASFVSNLMFHRESALARLTPSMLQSRYPHTALALALLREKPATFVPKPIVRVTLPPDAGDQPLLTSVDMARVMSDYTLSDERCRGDAGRVYSYLMKMLPTAIYQRATGRCIGDSDNPHQDLRLANVRSCYRISMRSQTAATVLWLIARMLPTSWLGFVLRRLSRHPR